MVERPEQIDPRVIYASLLVIVALAIVANLTLGMAYSIVSVLLIVIVAVGNIGYLYRKFKKN